ncbi:hypothetical protein AO369_0758 [Moraxella catarrhalis]|nr:hypothetical protein AO369_0758 [Moraxella catarrhalis]
MRQVFRQILIKILKNKLSTFIKATFRAMAILEHAQNKISQILQSSLYHHHIFMIKLIPN